MTGLSLYVPWWRGCCHLSAGMEGSYKQRLVSSDRTQSVCAMVTWLLSSAQMEGSYKQWLVSSDRTQSVCDVTCHLQGWRAAINSDLYLVIGLSLYVPWWRGCCHLQGWRAAINSDLYLVIGLSLYVTWWRDLSFAGMEGSYKQWLISSDRTQSVCAVVTWLLSFAGMEGSYKQWLVASDRTQSVCDVVTWLVICRDGGQL